MAQDLMRKRGTRVAVVGAGMAGATCARMLSDAGFDVTVFDKSRGVGGRMATRRTTWSHGAAAMTPADQFQAQFDHGAPGFSARSPEFLSFVEQACRDGVLSKWQPTVAPGSYVPLDASALWTALPDMPALCRRLLAGLPVRHGCAVDALKRGPGGWSLSSDGAVLDDGYAAAVVATPLPQAAPLLRPHRTDWVERAQTLTMRPGWTLMGITDDSAPHAHWDLAWPPTGPLAWVLRDDAKPGRQRTPGFTRWVVHATAPWSQARLESPPTDVQRALQGALADYLGRPLRWQHAAAHRWRYASALRAAAPAERCWWDTSAGLGVCGDALGGAGVEGAWRSARALTGLILGVAARAADAEHAQGPQAPASVASLPLARLTRFP